LRIKGNFLKDYVKLVNDTPELEWEKYLTDEDWEIVRGIVIPTSWYPVETMAHIGRGIFDMRSKNNYEVVRLHGRTRVTEVFDEGTQKFLLRGDPIDALRAYTYIAVRYVDELNIELVDSGPDFADVVFYPVDDAPAWDLFREIQAGTLEQLVELNSGGNARVEFTPDTRDGREACIMKVTWNEEK
jgi:hypothetical protein